MTVRPKPTPSLDQALFTREQACLLLQIGTTRLHQLINDGVLEVTKLGYLTRISGESVRKMLREGCAPGKRLAKPGLLPAPLPDEEISRGYAALADAVESLLAGVEINYPGSGALNARARAAHKRLVERCGVFVSRYG